MTAALLPQEAGGILGQEASLRRREEIQATSKNTLARRRSFGAVARFACYGALALAIVPLVALIWCTISKGFSALSVDFFAHSPLPEGIPGGGISNALAGTGIIVGLALCMAVPTGLAVALFLVERKGPIANTVRFAADVMAGVPSIAIGIVAYAVIVVPTHHYSAISASVALAVLMLPIVVRADEEALRNVPEDLWEAGMALGARRSKVVMKVVIRGALPGITTGNLLAVARAVGETAPLLFTTIGSTVFALSPFHEMNAVPLTIYSDATQPFADQKAVAWGAALVLLAFVLVLSIAARLTATALTRHSR